MSAGQQLRDARLGCGLSIAEVANRTKINHRQIEALEAEQYERLPGGVFIRGYVRALAPVVGLNPDDVAAALRSDVAPPADHSLHSALLDFMPGPPRLHLADEPKPEIGRSLRHVVVVLLAISAAAVVLLWLGVERSPRSAGDSPIVGSAPAQAAPAATPAPAPVGTSGR